MNEEIYNINQKSETKDIINFSICGITFPDKKYLISRPKSSISCIEFVEDGFGTVNIDGEKFSPKGGDTYFLQEGKRQYYFSDSERPWKKLFINLSGKLVTSLAEAYGISNTSYFPLLDTKSELTRIIELVKNSNDDCTSELISIINAIFLKMHNYLREKSQTHGIEAEMADFLNTQITSKFKIELLCRHISKSESQTIRLFKKAYGITPYAYVLAKKVELAKNLLTETNLSVKQISDKLSFTDEYYFSNIFKGKTGSTPTEYRKLRTRTP